jgi:hypothetical protein
VKRHKLVLKSILGNEGFEVLEKNFFKRKAQESVGVLDYFLPMMAVPRTIFSWLVDNIRPMEVGGIKDIAVPGRPDITMHIEKIDIDLYKAEFVQDSKVIHSFDAQSLPGFAANLMTVGELYDQLGDSSPIVSAVMKVNDLEEEHDQVDTANIPKDSIAKLIDAVSKLVDAVTVKPKRSEPKVEAKEEVKKEEITAKADGFSGAAKPTGPSLPKPPVPAGMNPKASAAKQAQTAASGGVAKPPTAPKAPKSGATNLKAPATPKLPKAPGAPKVAMKMEKTEVIYAKENEIYDECIDCGKPSFAKTVFGPKYVGCACYSVLTKSENGEKTWFVKLIKSADDKVKITFNPKADKDSVQAFATTMKATILLKREILRRGGK